MAITVGSKFSDVMKLIEGGKKLTDFTPSFSLAGKEVMTDYHLNGGGKDDGAAAGRVRGDRVVAGVQVQQLPEVVQKRDGKNASPVCQAKCQRRL